MNRREVAALLAYADRLDPGRAPTDQPAAAERLDQWCDLLADVAPTAPHPNGRSWDAAQVVRRHIATSPYPLKPSDIGGPWAAFRRDVVDRHTDPVPTVDPDDAAAYRAALVGTRTAVATGQQTATVYRELTGGPALEVAARLAALGEYMPRHVRDVLATHRPRRSEREQLAKANLPDPLDVSCTYPPCRALIGQPCRNHHRNPRAPHPTRVDAATARHNARQETAA